MSRARRTRSRSGLGRLGFGRRTDRPRIDPSDLISVHLYLGEGGRSNHDLTLARALDRLRREHAG